MQNTKIVTQKGMEIAQVLPKHNNYVMHTDNKILKIHTHAENAKQADPHSNYNHYMLQNYV